MLEPVETGEVYVNGHELDSDVFGSMSGGYDFATGNTTVQAGISRAFGPLRKEGAIGRSVATDQRWKKSAGGADLPRCPKDQI